MIDHMNSKISLLIFILLITHGFVHSQRAELDVNLLLNAISKNSTADRILVLSQDGSVFWNDATTLSLKGPQGPQGTQGVNCWDLNSNGINDFNEDLNEDGVFNSKDCRHEPHYIGELIGNNGEDGIVFWIDESGEHGLICSKEDLNDGMAATWRNGNDNIITNAKSHWDGRLNTDKILASQGVGDYATAICNEYSTPGTSPGEWYLPANLEIVQFINAAFEMSRELNLNHFFLSDLNLDLIYWSSTELNSNVAWHYSLLTNRYGSANKSAQTINIRIRAVRSF